MSQKRGKLPLIAAASTAVILIFAAAALYGVLSGKKYCYILSALIIGASCIPFFISFEKKVPSAGETAITACLCAAAVASRAAFYALPNIKPMCAVIVIIGAALGAETGFVSGALSAFASNFIFGQGIWTPFQMLGLGCVGLLAGLLFKIRIIRENRIISALTGGLLCFIIYGGIVDLSSVLMFLGKFSVGGIVSIYASGAVFNLVYAVTTAITLFVIGKPMMRRIDRIKMKYGIFAKKQ